MHCFALAGFLPALLVTSVAAQTSQLITETEFLSALDAEHPAVAERSEALAVARARVIAASTLENPAVGVLREDPRGDAELVELTISWQPPDRARHSEGRARTAAVRAAEAQLAQDLLSLRLEMRQAFAVWAVERSRQERWQAQASRIEALAQRERARAEKGESSGLEAARLGLAVSGLRAQLALTDTAAEMARGSAESWHPGLPAGAKPILPLLPPAADLDADHPRLRAAQAEIDAATFAREAAGRYLRSPEVTVGWQRQSAGPESFDGPILGLVWSVPLLDRNQAKKSMADARSSAAYAHLETVRREIGSGYTAARVAYQRLVAALADTEAALEGTGKVLRGTEVAFRLGEASLTDLLETQRSVIELEMAALDLHAAALAAHRELIRLAGPSPNHS